MATTELIAPDLRSTLLWMDTGRSVDERVDLLLTEMTLEEKVGQLGSRWVGNAAAEIGDPLSSQGAEANHDETLNVAPMQDVFAAIGSPPLEEARRHGLGHVQLYLHDVVATVARPIRQLVGFTRVALEPGEAVEVTFGVHADRTAFTGRDLRRIVEPGSVDVLIGTSAADLPCQGRVRLTGPVRTIGPKRRLVTPVDVRRAVSSGRA